MSGHSKWNNIKRKKEKTDGARAKVFTKIGREIAVAVKAVSYTHLPHDPRHADAEHGGSGEAAGTLKF